jgi:alpha-tubulin suppressor-like RCC1 family protein
VQLASQKVLDAQSSARHAVDVSAPQNAPETAPSLNYPAGDSSQSALITADEAGVLQAQATGSVSIKVEVTGYFLSPDCNVTDVNCKPTVGGTKLLAPYPLVDAAAGIGPARDTESADAFDDLNTVQTTLAVAGLPGVPAIDRLRTASVGAAWLSVTGRGQGSSVSLQAAPNPDDARFTHCAMSGCNTTPQVVEFQDAQTTSLILVPLSADGQVNLKLKGNVKDLKVTLQGYLGGQDYKTGVVAADSGLVNIAPTNLEVTPLPTEQMTGQAVEKFTSLKDYDFYKLQIPQDVPQVAREVMAQVSVAAKISKKVYFGEVLESVLSPESPTLGLVNGAVSANLFIGGKGGSSIVAALPKGAHFSKAVVTAYTVSAGAPNRASEASTATGGAGQEASTPPEVTIDPVQGSGKVDLGATPMVTFSGTASKSVRTVGIYAGSEFIGAATVDHTTTPSTWQAQVLGAVGYTNITASALSYEGALATASASVQADAPGAETSIMNQDSILMMGSAANRIALVNSDQLTFAGNTPIVTLATDRLGVPIPKAGSELPCNKDVFTGCQTHTVAPGDVIISGLDAAADDASNKSYMQRVVSVEYLHTKTVVYTAKALTDDALLQADNEIDQMPLPTSMPVANAQGVVTPAAPLPTIVTHDPHPNPNAVDQIAPQRSRMLTEDQVREMPKQSSGHGTANQNGVVSTAPNPDIQAALAQAQASETENSGLPANISPQAIGFSFSFEITVEFGAQKGFNIMPKGKGGADPDEGENVKASLAVGATVEISFALYLNFGLKIGIKWKWGFIPLPSITYFKFSVTNERGVDINFYADGTISISQEFPFPDIMLPTITFPAGPIVIVLQPALEPEVGITLSVGSGYVDTKDDGEDTNFDDDHLIDITWGTKGGSESGMELSNGSWHKIREKWSETDPLTLSFSGAITITPGAEIKFSIKLYGLIGPYVSIEAKFRIMFGGKMEREGDGPPQLSGSFAIDFLFGIGAGLEIEVLGWTLLDVHFDIYKFEKRLWSKHWGNDPPDLGGCDTDDDGNPLCEVKPTAVAPEYTGPGSVIAWGANESGQLGIGSQSTKDNTYASVIGVNDAKQVVGGTSTSYVLLTNGAVKAFGANDAGQLGNGSHDTTSSTTPVYVLDSAGAPLKGIKKIVARGNNAYALTTSGNVYAWGKNDKGQVGLALTTARAGGANLVPGLAYIKDLTATADGLYALRDDDTLWRLGASIIPGESNSHTPVRVTLPAGIFTADHRPKILASDDNSVYVMNNAGDIYGQGTPLKNGYVPIVANSGCSETNCTDWGKLPVSDGNNESVVAAENTVLVERTGGGLYAEGENSDKLVTPGTDGGTNVGATAVNIGASATAIAAGARTLYALASNGTVYSWGYDQYGQAGNFETTSPWTSAVHKLPDNSVYAISGIGAGAYSGYAIRSDQYNPLAGQLWAVGDSDNYDIGNGSKTTANDLTESTRVTSPVLQVAPGQSHTTVLYQNGQVQAFGSNEAGQLAKESTTTSSADPMSIVGISGNTAQIASGDNFSAALGVDGKVYYWGTISSTVKSEAIEVTGLTEGSLCGTKPVSGIAAHGTKFYISCSSKVLSVADGGTPTLAVTAVGDVKNMVALNDVVAYTVGEGDTSTIYAFGKNTAGLLGASVAYGGAETGPEEVGIPSRYDYSNWVGTYPLSTPGYCTGHLDLTSEGQCEGAQHTWHVDTPGQTVTTSPDNSCSTAFDTYPSNPTVKPKDCKPVYHPVLENIPNIKALRGSGDALYAVTSDGKIYGWGSAPLGAAVPTAGVPSSPADGVSLDGVPEPSTNPCISSGALSAPETTRCPTLVGATGALNITDAAFTTLNSAPHAYILAKGAPMLELSGQEVPKTTDYTDALSVFGGYGNLYVTRAGQPEFTPLKPSLGFSVFAAGSNVNKQLGQDNAQQNFYYPSLVSRLGNDISYISSSDGTTLATGSDGKLYAMGKNDKGQFGVECPGGQCDVVQLVTSSAFKDVYKAQVLHGSVYALMQDGSVYAWGDNDYGQLGLGTSSGNVSLPTKVQGLPPVKDLRIAGADAASIGVIALTSYGTVYTWGPGSRQKGKPTSATNISPRIDLVLQNSVPIVDAIYSTGQYFYAVRQNVVYSWQATSTEVDNIVRDLSGSFGESSQIIDVVFNKDGLNFLGSAGNFWRTNTETNTSSTWVGGTNPKVTQLAGSPEIAYEGLANVAAQAKGANGSGQLGLGDNTPRSGFTRVPGVDKVQQIVIGQDSTFILGSMETLHETVDPAYAHIWGEGGAQDALEDQYVPRSLQKTVDDDGTPTQVALTATQIVGNAGAHFALTADGTVYSWGLNTSGRLGNPALVDGAVISDPTAVNNLTNVTQIASGTNATYALRKDGTVWSWGSNANGQLGANDSGQITSRAQPGIVWGLRNIKQIAAGDNAGYAIDNSGNLFVWGSNEHGQLGLGRGSDAVHYRPELNTALTSTSLAKIVSAGDSVYALTPGGTLYTWGDNAQGQLAQPHIEAPVTDSAPVTQTIAPQVEMESTDVLTPTAVPSPVFADIDAAEDWAAGILKTDDDSNGTAVAWGKNKECYIDTASAPGCVGNLFTPTALESLNARLTTDDELPLKSLALSDGNLSVISKNDRLYTYGTELHGLAGSAEVADNVAEVDLKGAQVKYISANGDTAYALLTAPLSSADTPIPAVDGGQTLYRIADGQPETVADELAEARVIANSYGGVISSAVNVGGTDYMIFVLDNGAVFDFDVQTNEQGDLHSRVKGLDVIFESAAAGENYALLRSEDAVYGVGYGENAFGWDSVPVKIDTTTKQLAAAKSSFAVLDDDNKVTYYEPADGADYHPEVMTTVGAETVMSYYPTGVVDPTKSASAVFANLGAENELYMVAQNAELTPVLVALHGSEVAEKYCATLEEEPQTACEAATWVVIPNMTAQYLAADSIASISREGDRIIMTDSNWRVYQVDPSASESKPTAPTLVPGMGAEYDSVTASDEMFQGLSGDLLNTLTFADGQSSVQESRALQGASAKNLMRASAESSGSVTYALGVKPVAPSLDATFQSNQTAVASEAFTLPLPVSGVPYPNAKMTGTLPAGMTLARDANGAWAISGVVSKTTLTGDYPVTLTFENTAGKVTVNLKITVSGQSPSFTTADNTFLDLINGDTVSLPLKVTGQPAPALSISPALPAGLSLSEGVDEQTKAALWEIKGVPDALPTENTCTPPNVTPAGERTNCNHYTITATSELGTATLHLYLRVVPQLRLNLASELQVNVGSSLNKPLDLYSVTGDPDIEVEPGTKTTTCDKSFPPAQSDADPEFKHDGTSIYTTKPFTFEDADGTGCFPLKVVVRENDQSVVKPVQVKVIGKRPALVSQKILATAGSPINHSVLIEGIPKANVRFYNQDGDGSDLEPEMSKALNFLSLNEVSTDSQGAHYTISSGTVNEEMFKALKDPNNVVKLLVEIPSINYTALFTIQVSVIGEPATLQTDSQGYKMLQKTVYVGVGSPLAIRIPIEANPAPNVEITNHDVNLSWLDIDKGPVNAGPNYYLVSRYPVDTASVGTWEVCIEADNVLNNATLPPAPTPAENPALRSHCELPTVPNPAALVATNSLAHSAAPSDQIDATAESLTPTATVQGPVTAQADAAAEPVFMKITVEVVDGDLSISGLPSGLGVSEVGDYLAEWEKPGSNTFTPAPTDAQQYPASEDIMVELSTMSAEYEANPTTKDPVKFDTFSEAIDSNTSFAAVNFDCAHKTELETDLTRTLGYKCEVGFIYKGLRYEKTLQVYDLDGYSPALNNPAPRPNDTLRVRRHNGSALPDEWAPRLTYRWFNAPTAGECNASQGTDTGQTGSVYVPGDEQVGKFVCSEVTLIHQASEVVAPTPDSELASLAPLAADTPAVFAGAAPTANVQNYNPVASVYTATMTTAAVQVTVPPNPDGTCPAGYHLVGALCYPGDGGGGGGGTPGGVAQTGTSILELGLLLLLLLVVASAGAGRRSSGIRYAHSDCANALDPRDKPKGDSKG